MKEVEAYFSQSKNLKQAEESLAKKNLNFASVVNYKINVFYITPRCSCLLSFCFTPIIYFIYMYLYKGPRAFKNL